MLMSLTFIDNGNWGTTEALPQNAPYRKQMLAWARSYNAMCAHYNKTGQAWEDPSILAHQLDASLFREGVKPKEYQVPMMTAMINLTRTAVFAGLGAGKTFMAGGTAWHIMKKGFLANNPKQQRFLIVAPKSVVGEWKTQLPQFMDCKVALFPDENTIDANFVVTNFEQVEKLIPYRDWFGGIIVDESQNIKNANTNRMEQIMAFCDGHIQSRFVLTATPIVNKPDDLFPQLSFINPYAFNFSYDFMLSRYFQERGFGARKKKIFLSRGNDVFQFIVQHNALLIVTPQEGRLATARDNRKFTQNADQKRYIETVAQGQISVLQAVEDTATAMDVNAKRLLTIELKNALMKECQISSGFLKAGDQTLRFNSNKLAFAYDVVKNHWNDEQVILWVYFRETAERLQLALKDEAVVILGGMSNTARQKALDLFKSGKKRIAILQLKAANAGLNLQFCRNAIFVELDWAPPTIDQAVGRIDRPGQKAACRVLFLYTEGTTDELMLMAYQQKTNVTSAILKNFVRTRNIQGSFKRTEKSTGYAFGGSLAKGTSSRLAW